MEFPTAENAPTPCGFTLNLFRTSQFTSGKQIKNPLKFIKTKHGFHTFYVWGLLLGSYSTKWEFDGIVLRPMGTRIGKTTHGSVLGAQSNGETHRQNDTSLAGRPKDTNPYLEEAAAFGGRPPLVLYILPGTSRYSIGSCAYATLLEVHT